VWRVVEFRAAPRARSRLDLGRVVWAAGQVFSFEAAFLLFIFSGAYKIDPRFAWFPGDMSVVLFGLSVVAGLVPLLRGSLLYVPGIKAVCAGGIFVFWMIASQIWSPSEIYANEKLTETIAGNLWCLGATGMIIASSRVRVWRFLILLLVFGVVTGVDYAIFTIRAPEIWRVDYYLALGRLCGLSAIVAFVLWLRSPPRSARGPILLAAFAVCGYVLLKAGGRMPIAAVAVGMLLPPLLSFRLPHGQLFISRSILASLGLVAALALIVTGFAISHTGSLRTLQRFDTFMSKADSGETANPRFKLWPHAVAYWTERPLVGHGVGAWPILYMGKDKRQYPHNLILELLVEQGLVGVVLFAGLVLVLVWRVNLRRLREDPALMCAVMLCINAFVNAMSSGDISDNRNLFAMLGLLVMRSLGGSIEAHPKGVEVIEGAGRRRPGSAERKGRGSTLEHGRNGRYGHGRSG
jgi:O-antigen ligase